MVFVQEPPQLPAQLDLVGGQPHLRVQVLEALFLHRRLLPPDLELLLVLGHQLGEGALGGGGVVGGGLAGLFQVADRVLPRPFHHAGPGGQVVDRHHHMHGVVVGGIDRDRLLLEKFLGGLAHGGAQALVQALLPGGPVVPEPVGQALGGERQGQGEESGEDRIHGNKPFLEFILCDGRGRRRLGRGMDF